MVSYIVDLCMIIVLAAPLYLLIRKPWQRSRRREMLLMGFWLFNAALLMLALDGSCPAPSEIVGNAVNRIVTRDGINLVPFRTIRSYFSSPSAEQFLLNIVGNTVMFMPWGFGLSLLWERNRNPFRIAGLSLAFTGAIELCQLFVGRAVDVDDIILNFTGSMLGAAAWYIVDRIWLKKAAKQPHLKGMA